ncbi:MAG: LamG-like jellyroll fold domain-containing protein, partial [Planctomycetota bacterium]
MYKKSILLICFVLVLAVVLTSIAQAVDPTLVGWWRLDEDSGITATDSSSNGIDGTLIGGPVWVPGQIGGALQFDGSDDYVDFGNPPGFPAGISARSMCGWGKTDTLADGWRWIAAYGSPATSQAMFIGINGDDLFGGGYGDDVQLNDFWGVGVWHHICLTYDGTTARLYADGIEVASAAKNWNLILSRAHLGRQVNDIAEFWDGLIDDVRIYSKVLSQAEIEAIMLGEGNYEARDPDPADGAEDVSIDTNLTWTRGDGAKWDKVYFGTDPCDANLTLVDTLMVGVDPAQYDPGDPNLLPSTTYYWYITEVNAPNEYPGPVWSFTTVLGEAQCQYPVDGTVIPGDPYPPTPSILYTELIFNPGPTAVKHTGYLSKVRDKVVNRAQDANLGSPPLEH